MHQDRSPACVRLDIMCMRMEEAVKVSLDFITAFIAFRNAFYPTFKTGHAKHFHLLIPLTSIHTYVNVGDEKCKFLPISLHSKVHV